MTEPGPDGHATAGDERPPATDVLDVVAWSALRGPHRSFAETVPGTDGTDIRAARYPTDVAPFAALQSTDSPEAWQQLEVLVGAGGHAASIAPTLQPPAGWTVARQLSVFQLTGADVICVPDEDLAHQDDDMVALTGHDVPDMLKLVDVTRPGPFAARTIELGGYVGIKHDGRLVAMAGHRLQVSGWIEVSAVCTHPDHRGRGLSRRLMNTVIANIRTTGQQPFLHVVNDNPALALYERLGFSHNLTTTVHVLELG